MTAGQGYIALAALIFGKWRPVPAMLACLMFGFLDAAAIRLQGVVLPVIGPLPVQLIQALPYVLRSEEHTSELQSLMRISYAVFCLKKKKKIKQKVEDR